MTFANSDFIDTIIEFDTEDTNVRAVRNTHDRDIDRVQWKNLTRSDVFDLTPYDQTLLLDADYLMFSNNLSKLFDTDLEFTCHKDVYDITGQNIFRSDERLSPYSIPMLWATAIYFRKTAFSKSVFDMMKLVKENYGYYAKLYGFRAKPFRNDFALSIAYHAMSGYGLDNLLPYKLPSLASTTDVVDFRSNGQLLYQYKKGEQLYTGITEGMDLHIMNKEIFTESICDRMLEYATA